MDKVKEYQTWTFGPWTMKAYATARDEVEVYAMKFGPMGSRHGQYIYTEKYGVTTVSMADAKVNQHMKTKKVEKLLTAMTGDKR